MKIRRRIPLHASAHQHQRLRALQAAFAQVCNELAPHVQRTRVWNRVALHHMFYKPLRERHPALGSQMACNAIYAVSRAARAVYQHPQSPYHVSKFEGQTLPLIRFSDESPVYFDRHTLSIKGRQLSMYTLDGRMRFEVALGQLDEAAFRTRKLYEIMLLQHEGHYCLDFVFGEPTTPPAEGEHPLAPEAPVPDHVEIQHTA